MNYDTSKIDEWALEMCRDYLSATMKHIYRFRLFIALSLINLAAIISPHKVRFEIVDN